MNRTKFVLVVRKDLQMRAGKIASQCCHATQYMIQEFLTKKEVRGWRTNDVWNHWAANSFAKICLYCNSEAELLEIKRQVDLADLPVFLIEDEGRTEFDGKKTLTCLGIGPCESFYIDKITGSMKLL